MCSIPRACCVSWRWFVAWFGLMSLVEFIFIRCAATSFSAGHLVPIFLLAISTGHQASRDWAVICWRFHRDSPIRISAQCLWALTTHLQNITFCLELKPGYRAYSLHEQNKKIWIEIGLTLYILWAVVAGPKAGWGGGLDSAYKKWGPALERGRERGIFYGIFTPSSGPRRKTISE
jgi:hypothetical protein